MLGCLQRDNNNITTILSQAQNHGEIGGKEVVIRERHAAKLIAKVRRCRWPKSDASEARLTLCDGEVNQNENCVNYEDT
jgi:hypothetical protein